MHPCYRILSTGTTDELQPVDAGYAGLLKVEARKEPGERLGHEITLIAVGDQRATAVYYSYCICWDTGRIWGSS